MIAVVIALEHEKITPRQEYRDWEASMKAFYGPTSNNDRFRVISTPIVFFRTEREQAETVKEALLLVKGYKRVFVEFYREDPPSNIQTLENYIHPQGDVVYIFGSTETDNKALITENDDVLYINTPYKYELFASSAWAIISKDRFDKGG